MPRSSTSQLLERNQDFEEIELETYYNSDLQETPVNDTHYGTLRLMPPDEDNKFHGTYNDLSTPIEDPTFIDRAKHTILSNPKKSVSISALLLIGTFLSIYYGLTSNDEGNDPLDVLTTVYETTTGLLTTVAQTTTQALTTVTSSPTTFFSTTQGGDPRCIDHEVPDYCCDGGRYIC